MSEQQRAVFRGGPNDKMVWPAPLDSDRIYFEKGDGSGSNGVYGRTDEVVQLPDGPAVVFDYLGPSAEDL